MSLPRLTGRRPPVATALLTAVYAAAVVVALAAPGADTLAGLVVLAGLTARWAVHRRRSTAGAVAVTTGAADAVVPEPAVAPTAAPATAA
ncbi:hypothetical protein HGI15_12440 [Modestobacter lapidis]|nr:hypothetical protein [Modestobacter lapidis]